VVWILGENLEKFGPNLVAIAFSEIFLESLPKGTIRLPDIPQQNFDTLEQNALGENLSFNPWHALPEHRPLGSINRMRKVVYERISGVRREMNSVERREP
jgi:hypothetical protein